MRLSVLSLCVEAGLVRAGLIAVDGSKFAAAASDSAICAYEEIATEVLAEAAEMQALNAEVEVEGRTPEDVARDFLVENGFLAGG